MFKQLYCSKNARDPIKYTLKSADIEPASLTFVRHGSSCMRHALKIAHLLVAITPP